MRRGRRGPSGGGPVPSAPLCVGGGAAGVLIENVIEGVGPGSKNASTCTHLNGILYSIYRYSPPSSQAYVET